MKNESGANNFIQKSIIKWVLSFLSVKNSYFHDFGVSIWGWNPLRTPKTYTNTSKSNIKSSHNHIWAAPFFGPGPRPRPSSWAHGPMGRPMWPMDVWTGNGIQIGYATFLKQIWNVQNCFKFVACPICMPLPVPRLMVQVGLKWVSIIDSVRWISPRK